MERSKLKFYKDYKKGLQSRSATASLFIRLFTEEKIILVYHSGLKKQTHRGPLLGDRDA